MRCCVKGCKNDSRHLTKSQGITFHVFPNEPSLRLAWLKALDKEQWEPKERSALCSEHFLSEDLYKTKSGLRKVRLGAVPIILQNTMNFMNGDGEMPPLKVCRICLGSNCKLFSMRIYNLKRAYEDLTGIVIDDEDRLPQKLCYECAARLVSHSRFRWRSLRANLLMVEIVNKQDYLSEENLAAINKENNDLKSPLEARYYDTDYYDLHVDYEEEEAKIEIDKAIEREEEVQIKSESEEIFFNEEMIQNDEADDPSDGLGAGGEEFIRSEGEYSSDDSLPLEITRKKKLEEKDTVKVRKKKEKKPPPGPKIDRRRKPFLNNDLSESLFTITELSVEEQLAEIEKRQHSANYKNSVFKCTECYKGFLDEDAYNGHMAKHTVQCGEHRCEICKTHFKHSHALRKHITAHHTQRFSCRQCFFVTTHRQTARLHDRWHKGTKYHCPHCPEEFLKFTTYMGHVRIKHPSDFVCELCGYSFISAKGIELHKKLKHRTDDIAVPEDGPLCEICNVRFVSYEVYKRHLNVSARHNKGSSMGGESNKPKKGRKTKESAARVSGADQGEKKRAYPSQLKKVEGPIPCEQCGLQLEDSRAYHGHFRRMHPDKNRTNYPSMKTPCMCEVCGKMFQSHALLKDHRWVHTEERPFKCELCGKAFRMKQRLVAHRRVHALARALYACSLCGKNFSTHSNRQRHMFIHTGLKPYKCEMCGKGFKHASEKRSHITYVHLKKPWPKRARGKPLPTSANNIKQPAALPNSSLATGASETHGRQPMWDDSGDQFEDILVIDEKRMYYNIKM